jgi:hypothetical protein
MRWEAGCRAGIAAREKHLWIMNAVTATFVRAQLKVV